MPDIYGVNLSGGSRASISGFSSPHDFSVGLSGGSEVAGDITAGNADLVYDPSPSLAVQHQRAW